MAPRVRPRDVGEPAVTAGMPAREPAWRRARLGPLRPAEVAMPVVAPEVTPAGPVAGRPAVAPSWGAAAWLLSLLGHAALAAVFLVPGVPPEEGRGEPAIEVTLVSEEAPVGDAEADARAASEIAPAPTEISVDAPPEAALLQAPPDIPPAEIEPPPLPDVDVPLPEQAPPVAITVPEVDVPLPGPAPQVEIPMPSEPVAEGTAEVDVPLPEPVPTPVLPPEPPTPTPPRPTAKQEKQPAPVKPIAKVAPKPAARAIPAPSKAAAAVAADGENRADRTRGEAATGGAKGASAAAVTSWRAAVQAAILRRKPAPDDEREGLVRVGFSIGRSGEVTGVRIAASSGAAALDAAALAAVRRAAPFPPVPPGLSAPVAMEVPIRFQIQ
jgi:protein TonB